MTATVRLSLPFPPTVNNLFITRGRKRVRSPGYMIWAEAAGWQIAQQRPPRIKGQVNVRVDLVAPDRRRRDCDNLSKAVLDSIVAAGVIEDDSKIRRLSIGWEEEGEPCTVIVTACEGSS